MEALFWKIRKLKSRSRWVLLFFAAFCAAAITACTANPVQLGEMPGEADENPQIYGGYAFEAQLYMISYSSFIAFDDYKQYYMLSEDSLAIIEENGDRREIPLVYEETEVDEQTFKNSFLESDLQIFGDSFIPDISPYKKRLQLAEGSDASSRYRIYQMDDEIWLASLRDHFWYIYKIERVDEEFPVKVTIYGTETGVEDFLALQKDSDAGYEDGACYNITPESISRSTSYRIFKYDDSCSSFLLFGNEIYPLGIGLGGFGVTSMALFDADGDAMPELYFTFSFGSGMHRSHAAYFDPIAKQVVPFEYTHVNEDMMFTYNNAGGLSLYSATVHNIKGFTTFDVQKTTHISDVVYRDNQILLDPPPEK